MERLLRSGLGVWRKVAGTDTPIERYLRGRYRAVRSRIERKYIGPNYVLFWSNRSRGNRIGIYLKGDCHLVPIFSCQPWIQEILDGRCCMVREGIISDSRSDILLQTLNELPYDWLNPVIEKLRLPEDYFRPRLFESTFCVDGVNGAEEFPKTVVILSIGADAIRTAYRHRRHGFLVDPGEWWLNQPMASVLADLSATEWFKDNFEKVGKISVDAFVENFARIMDLLKRTTGAHILVFNMLTVEPGALTHNYQFIRNPPTMRWRELNLALIELSRRLDFSIVDLDRILKRAGIDRMRHFAHFPPEYYRAVAQEVFGIMQDLKIFH